TLVPDTFKMLLSQRRRWINSTVHNLMQLVLVTTTSYHRLPEIYSVAINLTERECRHIHDAYIKPHQGKSKCWILSDVVES
ncbi:hypothetical protein GGU11DRAFT_691063, partial [Lentinula aff. detonsa]